jgi:hypothetical protein
MGDKSSIYARVIRMNNREYDGVVVKNINCGNFKIAGPYWRVPVQDLIYPSQIKFEYRDGSDAKPSADSVRVIRVSDNIGNSDYWAVVGDTQGIEQFTNRCNECCGTETAWPVVAIPAVFIEDQACSSDAGALVIFTIVDGDAPAGQVFTPNASFDGVPFAPAASPDGFATVAAFITWAGTNWTGVTWANDAIASGRKVSFTKAGQTGSHTGSISMELKAKFDSNAQSAATKLDVIANGVTYPRITAADNASLVVAANADAALSLLGTFSVITGNKIRLVSKTVTTATLTLAA